MKYFFSLDNPPVEKVDMILAISSTATLGEQDFTKTKDVIESILNEYGRERIHYGVVLFGREPQVAVRLDRYYETDDQLMARLNSFDRDTGSADLAKVRLHKSWRTYHTTSVTNKPSIATTNHI